jgi:hypothetical protein
MLIRGLGSNKFRRSISASNTVHGDVVRCPSNPGAGASPPETGIVLATAGFFVYA